MEHKNGKGLEKDNVVTIINGGDSIGRKCLVAIVSVWWQIGIWEISSDCKMVARINLHVKN
jgi:hypothetical protein